MNHFLYWKWTCSFLHVFCSKSKPYHNKGEVFVLILENRWSKPKRRKPISFESEKFFYTIWFLIIDIILFFIHLTERYWSPSTTWLHINTILTYYYLLFCIASWNANDQAHTQNPCRLLGQKQYCQNQPNSRCSPTISHSIWICP